MSLDDWLRNGWLIEHRTSAREVADLLAVVERDLADSAAVQLSADWRLNIAYNAALQAATLRETIGASAELVNTFDAFRKKRNITGYERTGAVSDADAAEMRELALSIRDDVLSWLHRNHPKLIPR